MGLFQTIFGTPQLSQPTGTSGTKRTSFSSGKDTVTLTKGEVVKGEVTDLRSNEVTIRLDDGKTLHAKLSSAMELSIGQKAEFFVQETNDVLITLKLLSDGDTSFAESAIDKALEAAGFPKSAHAADIVRSLLTAGLPANKEMIQKMMQHSASNKDVELSTLTALLKNNLPVTKENASQLQAYRNFEHRLLGQASTLTSALSNAFSFGEVSPSFTEGLLTQFFGDETMSASSHVSQGTVGTSNAIVNSFGTETGSGLLPEGSANVTANASFSEMPSASGPASAASAVPESTPITPGPLQVSNATSETIVSVPTATETASMHSEETLPLKQLLSEKDYQAVQKALDTVPPDFPEFPMVKEAFTNGTLTANQLFHALSAASAQGHTEKVTALFKEEPSLSELLGKTLLNRFVMTPEDLTKEHAVEDFYARTVKHLSVLNELASGETASAMKTVADTGTHMQENIQFMNTLNQLFPYVQLPLKLTEQLTHGELYVYTKKKDLSAKNKEVSILLHLDMDALGPTDIHLSMLQQNVSAKFYLNEPDAEALVTEQLPSLTEALQKKGYSLNASVMHREKEPDIVSDFLSDGDAVPMKRFRFDIRA
ncbi:MAG: flagellar hook-length control protein FliK [Lachnospiraceae bacterium]|nr:flagellar hook-length control protein FliK [Lachnospiraceae bacterium]